eukprot:PhF_6_TR19675/c0_g1_i1/m.28727
MNTQKKSWGRTFARPSEYSFLAATQGKSERLLRKMYAKQRNSASRIHDALFNHPIKAGENLKPGQVAHIVKTGYRITSRNLRPAQVGVAQETVAWMSRWSPEQVPDVRRLPRPCHFVGPS